MRPTAVYELNPTELSPARKRHLEAHQILGSWHKVAEELRMNWRYVYNFAVHGMLPENKFIRRKLLGRKTINEHMAMDRISDMPTDLLKWAFEHREEMKP